MISQKGIELLDARLKITSIVFSKNTVLDENYHLIQFELNLKAE